MGKATDLGWWTWYLFMRGVLQDSVKGRDEPEFIYIGSGWASAQAVLITHHWGIQVCQPWTTCTNTKQVLCGTLAHTCQLPNCLEITASVIYACTHRYLNESRRKIPQLIPKSLLSRAMVLNLQMATPLGVTLSRVTYQTPRISDIYITFLQQW